jgi:very-short-patch-repair endonuclease
MPFDIEARIGEWQKSLLDTTRRNRLIKFTAGRGGGLALLHPTGDDLWQRLVVEGRALTFPWKRTILGLPAAAIDGEAADPAVPPDTSAEPERPSAATFPVASNAGSATTDAILPAHGPGREDRASPAEGDGREGVRKPTPTLSQPKTLRELTAECRTSSRLGSDALLTDLSDKKLAAQLLRLARSAGEAETDHGVSTLYAAFGFLRWYETQESQEELLSPLVLVPVRLGRESVDATWTLRAEDDDPGTNHCLAESLAAEFRLRLPSGPEADIGTDGPDGLAAYLERVAVAVKAMPRWEVVHEAALGVFNFQKLAMWEDLKQNAERVKAHRLCRAIAGDGSVELRPPPGLVAAGDLDERVRPEAVTHILDVDSSQQEAIEAVKRGADVVIDGPPGTGKSQTIANAIAELLAAGRTVLFVSEKTAALEVVKRRLDDRGLGDFCLELHSHKANKREVAAELGRCLDLKPEAYRDASAELGQLADDRRRLNAYVAELHRTRTPLGVTAYQVHGELARLANLADSSRWTAPDVFARDAEFLRRATDTLDGLARCRAVIDNPAAHPWRGCLLTAVTQAGFDDARHHLGRLADTTARLASGTTLADLALAASADTVGRWQQSVEFARSVLAVPLVPPAWFEGDPVAAVAAARALHAATTRVRHLADSLGAFSADAVARLDAEAVAKLAPPTSGGERLVGGASLSARVRRARLGDLARQLNAIAPALDRLAASLGRLLSALLLPSRTATVAQARKYARVAADLAAGPTVPPSWWDAARRAELQSVVAKAVDEELAAQSLRAALAGRISPAAFAPESTAAVRDALHHGGTFWRRLLPRWGALRRQVEGWYAGSPPDQAGLLADLAGLDAFHRRAGYARQVESAYAADLVTTAAGRADWAASAEGLKAVERYEKWKPSPELKAAMAPGGRLDRATLRSAADDLTTADGEFQTRWSELLTVYAADAAALDATAAGLAARLREERGAAETESAVLDRLAGLLRDGQDLPPGTWTRRAAELAERVALGTQIASLAGVLGVRDPVSEVEAADWSALAVTAGELHAFVARAGRKLSPSTVAALCDGAARERLRAAVAAAERATADGFDESWAYLTGTLFPPDASVSEGVVLSQAPIEDLCRWATARLADLPRLEEWVRYVQVRAAAASLGIESVVEEVATGRVGVDRAAAAFRRRFLGLWLDALYERVPELSRFSADDHDHLVDRFVRLDRLSVQAAPARLRSQLLASATRPRSDGSAPGTSELGILLSEANKKRKHRPVRRLFAEVPTLLPRLKPCLMMSPLAVSTYLNATPAEFDVVIFDEASQVRPHDAICAVYRGRQLVVAGDPRQLPPTDFFARSMSDDADTDDGPEGTDGFESLLDVCLAKGLVRRRLRWHYRSRREGLIAFSNQFIYGGGLVTFPSADDGAGNAVRFERVAGGQFADGVNVPEARRVADLVIEHARSSPDTSLGVIAFSQKQQNRILDELEARRKTRPDLEGFFKEDRADRFFVKNLENVQGDERDVIVLSVGYGPDATGKVAMRFGPLNRQGGERRLNVAVTRARSGMILVSSLVANDIDLSRTSAEGARLLRAFLDYAERGPRALTEAVTAAGAGEFDSPFEQEVHDELRRRGLTLHTQVGCGGYKIDMAVVAPGTAGRYALGVECDGATYHSSATARDRDRLRQSVLEGLGWRLCRIWSTDWLRNRDKQVQRVLAALEAASRPPAPVIELVPEPDEPAPVIEPVPAPPPPPPDYERIDDVPEEVVRATVTSVLTACGATEPDDLHRAVARRLGFDRTGSKIKQRLERAVEALALENRVVLQPDGRWGLCTSH